MTHKAGFVNIIGNPNVGKSTLMNKLVGEKLSIITAKSQTTRHRIMGIVTGTDFQIVYSDTPGIIEPKYKLQESMMKFVQTALIDADILLYVTDMVESIDKNLHYIEKVRKSGLPVLLILNKVDLSNQDEVLKRIQAWKELLPDAEILPVSARENFNIPGVLSRILDLLPENPPFYGADELTDKTERFFVSEIIREKILMSYDKEIPYSTEIEIEEFKEEESIIRIRAVIHAARDSQKGIIIGHQGSMLKKIGRLARLDMEAFFEKKVFLEMYVKVTKDWRENPGQLKRFGYEF